MSQPTANTPLAFHKAKVADLKIGDNLSEVQYYTVKDLKNQNGNITLTNERGVDLSVSPDVIEDAMYSATQFAATETISRTRAIEILDNIGSEVASASFTKKADAKSIAAATAQYFADHAAAGATNLPFTQKDLAAFVAKASKGEQREITFRILSHGAKLGRTSVIDLDKPSNTDGSNIRLIDHRSINWLIYKGVKYVISTK